MILPIVAYGAPILRKLAVEINDGYPQLDKLITDMWETMYASSGVGLAAPQINKDIRLFLVDSTTVFENLDDDEEGKYPDAPGIKKVFINAKITGFDGADWSYNEGCLSIPRIREDVVRPQSVTIDYFDEHFAPHTETFTGVTGRVIQHEYDHTEGKLFIDYMKPLRRKLLLGKLNDISRGKIKTDYKMSFAK